MRPRRAARGYWMRTLPEPVETRTSEPPPRIWPRSSCRFIVPRRVMGWSTVTEPEPVWASTS